jgi:hypothetical protein
MEARYATRKQQLLAECQVAPEIFDQVLPRLTTFMAPFVETFCRQELDQHAHTSICGLLSDVERKNIASIAYRFGQDRLPLQRFIGWAPWEDGPIRQGNGRWVCRKFQMLEDLPDDLPMRDGRDNPQRPPLTPGAARHIERKHALE